MCVCVCVCVCVCITSVSVAMISGATHNGDNEFELDRVPLRQVGGVRCGKGCVVCMGVGR